MNKNTKKAIFWTIVGGFVAANVMVYKHAYHFTHVSEGERPLSPEKLSFSQKLKLLLGGIALSKSQNILSPYIKSERKTFFIPTRKQHYKLECWHDKVENSKGIVLLFHGYGGCKSSYELEADYFRQIGYSTLLVDFVGHGGSEGTQITLGYKEAEDVKAVFEYTKKYINKNNKKENKNIILYGSSMGAASILRAIAVYELNAKKLILECPFATMKQTVKGRFEVMGVPSTGLAEWLMFWGGLQHGFWAFSHNPQKYAKQVKIPTLLMGGIEDARVKNWEIKNIYENLNGKKQLVWLPVGHESYIMAQPEVWKKNVLAFLE